MKRILATTALTASLCMPAFAQDATTTEEGMAADTGAEVSAQAEGEFIQQGDAENVKASDFIGKRVYSLAEGTATEGVTEADPAWDDIGEINDVVMTKEGNIEAVIVGVGGFLGIGEKSVALPMDDVDLVQDGDQPDEYFVTVAYTREALDQAPEYVDADEAVDQAAADDGEADTMATDTDMAAGEDVTADPMAADPNASAEMDEMAESGDNAADDAASEMNQNMAATEEAAPVEEGSDDMAATEEAAPMEEGSDDMAATEEAAPMEEGSDDMAATEEAAPMEEGSDDMAAAGGSQVEPMEGFTRDGYSEVAVTQLSSDDLVGTPVYDPEDNRVGEISELLMASDGTVTDAVIDVGGFLGIGEKPVAISFDGISLQQQMEGTDIRAYVNTTEDQLENFPEYEEKG